VDVAVIKNLLRDFRLPQLEFALGNDDSSLALDYISDRSSVELAEWDIAIPFRRKVGEMRFPFSSALENEIFCRERHSGVSKSDDPGIVKITEKNIVADSAPHDLKYGERSSELEAKILKLRAQDPKISVEKACLLSRERPLLVIHVLHYLLDQHRGVGRELKFELNAPVVTLSLAFPDTRISPKPREYAISVRMAQLLEKQLEEAETDEDSDDEL
jgi:hypothetical protein